MLTLLIPKTTWWDEIKEEFVTTKECKLTLEHSLVSISKWESKHHKSFFTEKPLSREESLDYIRCMTITQNVDPLVYGLINDDMMTQVNQYIDDSMTATTFSTEPKRGEGINGEKITAEIVYCWMTMLNIPTEYQKWHFNKLMTLIRVCSIKSQPEKKMTRAEALERTKRLNAERRAKARMKGK